MTTDDDDVPYGERCPLCGQDVAPGKVRLDSGVPWGSHHHAHALCALENMEARVAELERLLVATAKDWIRDTTLSGHTQGWRERLRQAAGFFRQDAVPAHGLVIITAQWGTAFTAVIDAKERVWLRYWGCGDEVSPSGLLEAHAAVMEGARRCGHSFLPKVDQA